MIRCYTIVYHIYYRLSSPESTYPDPSARRYPHPFSPIRSFTAQKTPPVLYRNGGRGLPNIFTLYPENRATKHLPRGAGDISSRSSVRSIIRLLQTVIFSGSYPYDLVLLSLSHIRIINAISLIINAHQLISAASKSYFLCVLKSVQTVFRFNTFY